jgi:hypothetical protein
MSGSNPSAGGSSSSNSASSASSSSSAAAAAGGVPSAPAIRPAAAPAGDASATAALAAPAAAAEEPAALWEAREKPTKAEAKLAEAKTDLAAAKVELAQAEADLVEAEAELELYEFHEKWEKLLAKGNVAWNKQFSGPLPYEDAKVLLDHFVELTKDEKAGLLRYATQTATAAINMATAAQAEVTRCGAKVDRLETELKPRQPEAPQGAKMIDDRISQWLSQLILDSNRSSDRADIGEMLRRDGKFEMDESVESVINSLSRTKASPLKLPEVLSATDATNEAPVQKFIQAVLEPAAGLCELQLHDTHGTAVFRTRRREFKPDLCVTDNEVELSGLMVMTILEVKTDTEVDKNASIGRIAQYLNEAMRCSPSRARAIGLLLSHRRVRYFVWTRNNKTEIERKISFIRPLNDVMEWERVANAAFGTGDDVSGPRGVARKLADAKLPTHDFRLLGTGGSAICYAVGLGQSSFAIKVLNERDGAGGGQDTVDHESKVLRDLKHQNVGGVPEVHVVPEGAVELGDGILVTSPAGSASPPASPTDLVPLAKSLVKLAEILHNVHCAGYVHCDVRDMNVCFVDSGPLLIDFGCARQMSTVLGSAGEYSGTLSTAADDIIEFKLNQLPGAELIMKSRHDMESLAKLAVLRCMKPGVRRTVLAAISMPWPNGEIPAVLGASTSPKFVHAGSTAMRDDSGGRWARAQLLWGTDVLGALLGCQDLLTAARAYDHDRPETLNSFKSALAVVCFVSTW